MKKIEYSEGFIIYNDTISEEALCQFKEYIDNQQKFLNENGIEWVKGTILKGSGSTYAEFEGMLSVKSVQKIEAMFVTYKQYENLKELMDSFEAGENIANAISERIDNGNYLFMANLQSFERVAEVKKPAITEKRISILKPYIPIRNPQQKETMQINKTKSSKSRIISPSDILRKLRKK